MGRPASLLLASRSPRRRELLESAGFAVTVRDPNVDESWPGGEPGAAAVDIARRKLTAVQSREPASAGQVAVAADTVVVIDEQPLGKPVDAADAARMLGHLSGRDHFVVTGFCVGKGSRQREGAVRTTVRFRSLSAPEIERYVATGEPLDKAGAYGIQGLGGALVDHVEGSYTNVVGLPLHEVISAIEAVWGGA